LGGLSCAKAPQIGTVWGGLGPRKGPSLPGPKATPPKTGPGGRPRHGGAFGHETPGRPQVFGCSFEPFGLIFQDRNSPAQCSAPPRGLPWNIMSPRGLMRLAAHPRGRCERPRASGPPQGGLRVAPEGGKVLGGHDFWGGLPRQTPPKARFGGASACRGPPKTPQNRRGQGAMCNWACLRRTGAPSGLCK